MKRRVNILYLGLLSTFVLVAAFAFVIASKGHLFLVERQYLMGTIIALTSLPHLFIFILNGGVKNKNKIPYAVYGILGIGIGCFIMLDKSLELDVICLIWGVFDITRSLFEIFDIVPEVLEKKYIEIIEILISIAEIVIAVLLIINKFEDVLTHITFVGISFSIYFSKYILANLLEKKK